MIPAIVGPTASGKSELGIKLAQQFHGEIINLDSVQVYRRIYVATAKVPPAEQGGVPHHLIDLVEPTENFTAGEYAKLAIATIEEIEARQRMAILVGGTGFYLRAITHPVFASPATDLTLRERLMKVRDRHSPEHLHRLLRRLDAKAAAAISPRDWSKALRALAFYFQTGRRISEAQKDLPPPPPLASRIRIVALSPPRDLLYEKINRRAELMFASGLIEEVKGLLESGVPANAKAFQAHGYRRVVEYLQGWRTREDALNQMKLDTRHYAKRQLSWWRAQAEVKWLQRFGDDQQAFHEASDYLSMMRDKDL
ncbi:MAG: tRNA (adenosine(37)-N6)-dimethylallyltransferase MiaA [Acidobacteria bacterium]|nr:tRNA (adenosine(37)-N6)-dimethylallyltransferase MiaA [Acidobacteriota bacterium]